MTTCTLCERDIKGKVWMYDGQPYCNPECIHEDCGHLPWYAKKEVV